MVVKRNDRRNSMAEQIKPGFFSKSVAADDNRILFDIQNEQLLCKQKKIDFLFIGDSITWMWDLNLYFGPGAFFVNRGIGGDVSAIALKRFRADCLQLNPSAIVYMIGTNDILPTAPDLWWRKPGADKNRVLEQLLANIEEAMRLCAGKRLYQCSILPTDICPPFDKAGINQMVQEANDGIKVLCSKHGVPYVDYHSALCREDKKTMKDGLTHDGIHPNGACYEIMANVLKQEIDFQKEMEK